MNAREQQLRENTNWLAAAQVYATIAASYRAQETALLLAGLTGSEALARQDADRWQDRAVKAVGYAGHWL